MGTYNENIYPSKMFLVDLHAGTESESSAASVQLKTAATYRGRNYRQVSELKGVRFLFNIAGSSHAGSKRLKSGKDDIFLRVSAHSANISGQLPSGAASAFMEAVEVGYIPYAIATFTPGEISKPVPYVGQYYCPEDSLSFVVGPAVTVDVYGNVDYSFNASFTVDGIGSANKPYRALVWEDIVPVLGGFAPSGGAFINRASAQTFTFTVRVDPAYDGTVIGRTTTFRWRVQGSTTERTLAVTGQSVTVPANTFPAQSTIEWRVECTTAHGQSAVGEWQTVTTADEAPGAPTNLAPQNVFLHNDEDNVFSWHHNSPNGTVQTRAELQWSADGSAWSALANVSGSADHVTVPANTLTAGQKLWRVRTYNAANVAGEWSESAQIVLMGAPSTPAILALTAAPRAYVKWSSADQLGWRVTFSDANGTLFDSGEQFGDAREYRAEGFLADGMAHYSVAVANEYGWSVTEGDFTVENAGSGAIALTAQEIGGEALLRWSASGAFDDLYVLRGGVPIARVTGLTEYIDKTGAGAETYEILGTAGANYTRSNAAEVLIKIDLFRVYADGVRLDLNARQISAPTLERSAAADVSYYHFSGQRYPTAYTHGTQTGVVSIAVTTRDADKLEVGKLYCLRDSTGWRGYGVLESISHSVGMVDDATLSFALVEHSEAVAYDS